MPERDFAKLIAALRRYGSDLSNWPDDLRASAREALVANPEVRRAWENERPLDRRLAQHRATIDSEIAQSGAAARIRRNLLARLATDPSSAIPWRSVAAAMLVAGMIGGAIDLVLPEPLESADIVMLDLFDALDGADMR